MVPTWQYFTLVHLHHVKITFTIVLSTFTGLEIYLILESFIVTIALQHQICHPTTKKKEENTLLTFTFSDPSQPLEFTP